MASDISKFLGSPCPTWEEWRSALRGQVNGQRWSEFEGHLQECPRCESTVDALTEQSDTLVRDLCRCPSNVDDEPAFRALYADLISVSESAWDPDPQPAAAIVPDLPFRLGNYELLTPLGHGANGSVFQARHIPLDRKVAIKLLRPDRDFDPARVDRFVQEVRAVGCLDHPHLVRATDAGETEGRHYLVMEYVPGADVSTVVSFCQPLRTCDVCEMVRQTALGLAYLHENGFAHRDVKPSNLLLTADGQIKLLDLGLVQFIGKEATVERQTTAAKGRLAWPNGTPDYMPPEQWQAFDQLDTRSDLYSLGCTLCKLLTGLPPYRPLPAGFADRCEAHCGAPIPDLAAVRPDVSAELQTIFARMVAKQPAARYDSAVELERALRPLTRGCDLPELARQAGVKAAPAVAVQPHLPQSTVPVTRRRAVLAMAAGFGSVAAGVFAVRTFRREAGPKIETGSWRRLSPEPPEVLLATQARTSDLWELTEDAETVVLRSPRHLLLNLGQPLLGSFRLAVEMSQQLWQGDAGWFFHFHRQPGAEKTTHCYQTLELIRGHRKDPDAFRLLWSGFRAELEKGAWQLRRDLWADTPVPPPGEGEFPELQVWLGIAGFPQVYWRSQHLAADRWTISVDGRRQAAVSKEQLRTRFLGHVGLLSAGGPTVFRRPRLAYVRPDDTRSPARGS